MMKKLIYKALAFVGIVGVMGYHTFAVAATYTPNIDVDVKVDKAVLLEEEEQVTYTQEDVDRVLEIYSQDLSVTEDEIAKYDLNGDGVLNANDAAMICDLLRNE